MIVTKNIYIYIYYITCKKVNKRTMNKEHEYFLTSTTSNNDQMWKINDNNNILTCVPVILASSNVQAHLHQSKACR